MLTITEIEEFKKILSELNCSNHSINSACKWIINHKQCAIAVCNQLKSYFIENLVKNQDNNNDDKLFDKKLYILFMINDVLHQTVKTRILTDKIDLLSQQISNILFYILPHSYKGYDADKQQKVMSLLNLWAERNIFSIQLTKNLKNIMIGTNNNNDNNNNNNNNNQPPATTTWTHPPTPHIQPPPINPLNVLHHPYPSWPHPTSLTPHSSHTGHPPHINPSIVLPHPSPFAPRLPTMPQLPQNSLHVSIGKIKDLALELRRTGGGGT